MHGLFSFTSKERRGILVLLMLILILIVLGKLIPYFVPERNYDLSKWEAEVNNFLAGRVEEGAAALPFHPVVFDPNKVDSSSLVRMGVPSIVASHWTRYLLKGGRFKTKDEIHKIYGMTPRIEAALDQYMIFPSHVSTARATKKRVKASIGERHDSIRKVKNQGLTFIPQLFELNSVDSSQLLKVYGIGPILASRIVRYRNLLGGYFSVVQLKEVYGMREESFNLVSPSFIVDTSKITALDLNFATLKEMGRHPYIGFKSAHKIFQQRDQKGKILSLEDLVGTMGCDSLQRLRPYLRFRR